MVYTDYRPTPLQHYIFPGGGEGLHLVVDELGNFKEETFLRAMASLSSTENQAKENKMKGKKGGSKGPSDCFKIVKMIMDRGLQPVIVFSFSKRECENHAMQMAKLDFTTGRCFSQAGFPLFFSLVPSTEAPFFALSLFCISLPWISMVITPFYSFPSTVKSCG